MRSGADKKLWLYFSCYFYRVDESCGHGDQLIKKIKVRTIVTKKTCRANGMVRPQ